jgi:hypothetical protein
VREALRGTLATARYRNGEWQEACSGLLSVVTGRDSKDPTNAFEGFFIAMAYWQLGEPSNAMKWLEKSEEWMSQGLNDEIDLRRSRDEAWQLIRNESPAPR